MLANATRTPPRPAPEDEQLDWLPVAAIGSRQGHNPRRSFDDAKMRELVASVRTQGVIQPIVVRPLEGGRYQIIAGERRWRAAKEVGLEQIPAVIRLVDALQAIEIAMVENTHRVDLLPSEEAQKARDLLTLCNGDRDETRRRLGWNETRLKSRLALLNCTPTVLAALDARTLNLGHGELLATLPAETQDATLPRIIEQRISVTALLERIGQVARPLTPAIFDKTGCLDCRHNSAVQRELFETHIDSGKCSNLKCYGEKTAATLAGKKQSLAEQYQSVWLDTERAPDTFAFLEATGPQGVGPQQFAQGCRGCANFGVLLATAPGREGTVTEDLCFHLPCQTEKQNAYRRLLQTPTAAPVKHLKAVPNPEQAGAARAGTATTLPDQPEEQPRTEATPKKVEETTDAALGGIAADLAGEDMRVARAVRLYALWRDAGFPDSTTLQVAALPLGRASALAALTTLEEADCATLDAALMRVILTRPGGDEWVQAAAAVIATTKTDLKERFRVDEPFLRAHRKAGMDALLREAGFNHWYDTRHGTAKYAALLTKKVDEIVAAATAADGFDWSGFVPSTVAARFTLLGKRR
ncbi:PRTRC system ParB family protein [Lamprocystis purpurea]|jgi:PRTRC genetic system ParB family protein|uniref:PRTRC system ParB family protein n=1 Tax=Lamprocystis purpurea TaxID=61598 RepID=UPI00037C89E9|nr:PRTRC system ParB family protein [Lamprocystis purpurea]